MEVQTQNLLFVDMHQEQGDDDDAGGITSMESGSERYSTRSRVAARGVVDAK